MRKLNIQKFAAFYYSRMNVKIVWNDNNNELGLRPSSVNFRYTYGGTEHTINISESSTPLAVVVESVPAENRPYEWKEVPTSWAVTIEESQTGSMGYLGRYGVPFTSSIEKYGTNSVGSLTFEDTTESGESIETEYVTIYCDCPYANTSSDALINNIRLGKNRKLPKSLYIGGYRVEGVIYNNVEIYKTANLDNLDKFSYQEVAQYTNLELSDFTHEQISNGNIHITENVAYSTLNTYDLASLSNYTHKQIGSGVSVEQQDFITFYMNDGTTTTEFYCEEGMTWQEYCASAYNTEGIYCYDPTPGNVTDYIVWPGHGYYSESCADIITDGTTYNRQTGAAEK